VLLYGTETWPVTEYLAERVSECEMRMLCYCLGTTLEEHKTNKSIRQEAKVRNVLELMRRRRLQRFGHIRRREKEDNIRRVHEMKVKGKRIRNAQSIDGRIQSEKISNPVPSIKRMLRTGLGVEA